jgi:MFS family permease
VLSGLLAGSINPLLDTVLYEQLPRAMRARVLGALTTGVTAGMPLGAFLGGVAATAFGLVAVLTFIAVAYGIVTLSPLFGRSWKGLDKVAAT